MELKNKVSITIPSTTGLDTPVDNSVYALEVAKQLANLFGGSRIVDNIQGLYISEDGTEVIEDNKDIVAYCDTLSDDEVEAVIKIALDLKSEMKQETILYTINNIAYIE